MVVLDDFKYASENENLFRIQVSYTVIRNNMWYSTRFAWGSTYLLEFTPFRREANMKLGGLLPLTKYLFASRCFKILFEMSDSFHFLNLMAIPYEDCILET